MGETTIKWSFIFASISNVMFIVLLENSPDISITASTFSDDVDTSSASTTNINLTVSNDTHSYDDEFYESLSLPVRIAIFSSTICTFMLLPFILVRVMSSESRYLLNMSRKMSSNTTNKYEDKTLTGNKTGKLKNTTDNTVTETTGRNKVKRVISVKTNLKRTAPSIISTKKKDDTETTTNTSTSTSKSNASNPLAVTSKKE